MGLLSAFFGLFSQKQKLRAKIDRVTGDIAAIDRALVKGRGDAPSLIATRSNLLSLRVSLQAQLAALG
jgi:hypothetical protein